MKVNEIKEKLDKFGIEYDKKAKKDELLKLLNEHKQEVTEKEEQKKYVVVFPRWKDLEDNGHIYKKGDTYPREGYTPTKKRIEQLTTQNNKIGEVLIREVE